jgi:hypothetical protein
VHFGVRLEDAGQCILVVIGATAEGKKELVFIGDGYRKSEASWKEVLLDLKARSLKADPKLAIGMVCWVLKSVAASAYDVTLCGGTARAPGGRPFRRRVQAAIVAIA